RQHHPGSYQDDAGAELAGLFRLLLPANGEVGEEAAPGRTLLRDGHVAGIAVVVDARGGDEDAHAGKFADARDDGSRSEQAGELDVALASFGPAPVGHGRAGEVDDGVYAC